VSENTDIAAEADVEVQEQAADQLAGQDTTSEDTTSEDAGSEKAPAGAAADEPGSETLDVPIAELRPALEAVLMIADQPLDHVTLASAVGYPPDQVAEALAGLAAEYAEQGRGFDLRNVAGGWRFYTREEYAAVVERFVLDGQQARLTQAALETLAVVAYKQPVSRARVAAIRGVNVDGVMRTLVARGLVEECGSDPETTALLYRTTSYFLERIGVQSIEELPELAPYLPDLADLEDELETVASESAPESHPTPEEGPSTEPDGGTEPT
jgi:segregation and condensation protein B